jgi:hypothetical protein
VWCKSGVTPVLPTRKTKKATAESSRKLLPNEETHDGPEQDDAPGIARATAPYVARQGKVLSRTGRVNISCDALRIIWVGGATMTRISGTVGV